jgi:hypothetical protein
MEKVMNHLKTNPSCSSRCQVVRVALAAAAALALASIPAARAGTDNRVPDLPSPLCDNVQVLEGNKVAFHVYAVGVQVYRWNGQSWGLVGPVASLFADSGYQGQVGIHYATPAGPAWESNSGSKVVARRLGDGCSPDPAAIPWLLLQRVSGDGAGTFSEVTYIQRVNTTGGLAPPAPGSTGGEEVQVPYTAEYYFYRGEA